MHVDSFHQKKIDGRARKHSRIHVTFSIHTHTSKIFLFENQKKSKLELYSDLFEEKEKCAKKKKQFILTYSYMRQGFAKYSTRRSSAQRNKERKE